MSERQRGRRLPVFVDEDQWRRAYEAARNEVALIFCNGDDGELPRLTPAQEQELATRVATAALRAAAQADEGDIAEVEGVHIDEVG